MSNHKITIFFRGEGETFYITEGGNFREAYDYLKAQYEELSLGTPESSQTRAISHEYETYAGELRIDLINLEIPAQAWKAQFERHLKKLKNFADHQDAAADVIHAKTNLIRVQGGIETLIEFYNQYAEAGVLKSDYVSKMEAARRQIGDSFTNIEAALNRLEDKSAQELVTSI
jgi:hypothetical protein